MQVTELAVGLTDGKGELVRLYDWLAQIDKADFLRLQEDIPGVQSVEI